MKIQKIYYDKYDINLAQKLKNSQQTYSSRQGIIVYFENEFYKGKGEAAPLDGFSKENINDVIWNLESLISAIELNVDYEFQELLDLITIHCESCPSLHFAIDTALYDLESQKNNCSLAKLINANHRNNIRFCDFYLPNFNLKEIKSNFLKYKIGINSIKEDLILLNQIAKVKPSINFRIDANQAFEVQNFKKLADKLKNLNIEYYEEPISNLSTKNLKLISNYNIALDESISNPKFDKWIKDKLIRYVILKPSIYGGFKKNLELIEKCNSNNIKIIFSSSLETTIGNMSTIHLAATINNPEFHGINIHNFYTKFNIQPIYSKNQKEICIKNIIGLGV